MTLRLERPADAVAIHKLTEAAFRCAEYSDGSEPEIVDTLRRDGDLALSLVAIKEEAIVGHVAFSPVTIADKTQDWYGLGPLSVVPDFQGTGIGSALVRAGIARMKEHGARGSVLLGSPDYYSRFDFQHDPDLVLPGPPPEFFQRLVLAGEAPSGTVRYAPAFG